MASRRRDWGNPTAHAESFSDVARLGILSQLDFSFFVVPVERLDNGVRRSARDGDAV
ncbi:MAG: hypothetical protein NVS2B14_15610 [Chamaesiphon sp.]